MVVIEVIEAMAFYSRQFRSRYDFDSVSMWPGQPRKSSAAVVFYFLTRFVIN